jgi:hypothetical protein
VDPLQTVVPSVPVQNFGKGKYFNIRGIGNGEHNTQTFQDPSSAATAQGVKLPLQPPW